MVLLVQFPVRGHSPVRPLPVQKVPWKLRPMSASPREDLGRFKAEVENIGFAPFVIILKHYCLPKYVC
jgi:hypothetical protein